MLTPHLPTMYVVWACLSCYLGCLLAVVDHHHATSIKNARKEFASIALSAGKTADGSISWDDIVSGLSAIEASSEIDPVRPLLALLARRIRTATNIICYMGVGVGGGGIKRGFPIWSGVNNGTCFKHIVEQGKWATVSTIVYLFGPLSLLFCFLGTLLFVYSYLVGSSALSLRPCLFCSTRWQGPLQIQ